MKVDDLETQNEILEGCGCCPFPTCPRALLDVEYREKHLFFSPGEVTDRGAALSALSAFDWDTIGWTRIYEHNHFSLGSGPSGLGGAGVEWYPGHPSAGVSEAYGAQFRYRRRVPFEHNGSYFKFAWNQFELTHTCAPVELGFPGSGFWTENYGDPSCYGDPVLTPHEYVWSGPGVHHDPEDPEDDSWFSEWSDPIYMTSNDAGVIGLQDDAWYCSRAEGQLFKPSRAADLAFFSPFFL